MLGFITKMAWRIMTQNSLATKFFHGKYLRQIDKPRPGPFTSSVWSAVRAAYTILLEDMIWIMGTDSNVKFWTDNWVGGLSSEL